MNEVDTTQAAFLLAWPARGAMALILAQSVWHALRDPVAHAGTVTAYRLAPDWAVVALAWCLPILSGVAASLLLLPATAHFGAMLAITLMLVFTLGIGINLYRGRVHIDCGCGSGTVQRISAALVVRNIVLLAVLAWTVLAPANGSADAPEIAVITLSAIALAAFYFAANQLLVNRTHIRAAGFTA
jgi:hypothetical protein